MKKKRKSKRKRKKNRLSLSTQPKEKYQYRAVYGKQKAKEKQTPQKRMQHTTTWQSLGYGAHALDDNSISSIIHLLYICFFRRRVKKRGGVWMINLSAVACWDWDMGLMCRYRRRPCEICPASIVQPVFLLPPPFRLAIHNNLQYHYNPTAPVPERNCVQ